MGKCFLQLDIKEVEEIWLTFFMITTNIKDYILADTDEIRKSFRVTMKDQFEHILFIKCFSSQLESGKTHTLQQRSNWWMIVVDKEGPIPNNVYEYSFAEVFNLCRKAIDPEVQEFVETLKDRHIIP